MTPPDLAAAILAGGRARRFGGRDKTRLEVAGRPIIVRQVEVLQRLTSRVFIVATEHRRFADLGIPVYADRVHDAGALGGLYTALTAADADRVVVVAADQPYLTAPLLRHLARRALDGDCAWVRTARGAEPLVACYRRRCLDHITAAVRARQLKASDLDQRLRMVPVTDAEVARFGPVDHLLTNINTPDDYSRIE